MYHHRWPDRTLEPGARVRLFTTVLPLSHGRITEAAFGCCRDGVAGYRLRGQFDEDRMRK
jgi:hypothetical protein